MYNNCLFLNKCVVVLCHYIGIPVVLVRSGITLNSLKPSTEDNTTRQSQLFITRTFNAC